MPALSAQACRTVASATACVEIPTPDVHRLPCGASLVCFSEAQEPAFTLHPWRDDQAIIVRGTNANHAGYSSSFLGGGAERARMALLTLVLRGTTGDSRTGQVGSVNGIKSQWFHPWANHASRSDPFSSVA